MAVYYKFKSAKDFESVPIDGHFISVANLKEKIFETKHLGRGTDFDLMVSNAQTNEEYPDPDMLIPKNTSVLVRRIPGQPRMPIVTEREETKAPENKEEESQPAKSSFFAPDASAMTFPEETEWDEFGNDLYAIPEIPLVQYSNQAQDGPPPNRDDEDSKIKALIDTPALDWQQQIQDGFGGGRGLGRGMGGRMMEGRGFGRGLLERKTPPPGYICHRCKVPGHFIQHCPTNGDPNFDIKKTKPPTGIPRSMLVPTPDGSYALPSGAVAVMKPNEAVFEKEIEGLPSTRSVNDIPPELRCPLCKEVMQDAVLTSKCCFKSFCDTCIRNHIISKLACACGARNVLADDLLPNKTVRETINRFLESNNSSAENAGSTLQVQDMESARPALPKVPSPILSASFREHMTTQPAKLKALAPTHSASSKGEQLPPIQKNEGLNTQEPATEAKDASAPQLSLGKGRDAKNVDACEATCDSMPVKVPMPQGSASLAEEEMQQKPSASEPGKKRKKKKARLPPNELQWRTPQDIGVENYMMPFPPPACDPYWGNMQLGMDGFMNPYGGTMPYMGCVPGPFDPMGGMLPQDHFGGPGYMMPGFPYQRDFSDFPVGSGVAPPIMSRAEFEARKAGLRRRHDLEGRAERIGSRDPEYEGRNVSNDGDISSLKSVHRMMSKGKSPDHHHRHYSHRDEEESSEDRFHHYRVERESSQDQSRRQRVERESSLDRSHQHHHRYHRDERQMSPEQGYHHRRHRRTESPLRDVEPVRHVKRRSDRHDLPPSRDLEPVRKRITIEQEDTVKDSGEDTAEKKQKASVFSRISFPGETGGNKKRKVPLEGSSHLSNGYKVQKVQYANSDLNEIKRSEEAILASDHDSSDDDERHFKRRPARYEPPPPPIEWEEDVRPSRSSRERGHNKHRDL